MVDNLLASKQYNSIDLFKFIFAFAVISIHTQPLINCSTNVVININEAIIRMAVPFYFIASGYLLGQRISFENNNYNPHVFEKYLLRILKMYIIWMLIYSPLAIINYIKTGTSFIKAVGSFLIGLFFVGEQYNNWVLWYLLSTIYAVLLIWLISRRGLRKRHLIGLVILASIMVAGFGYIGNSSDYNGALGIFQKVVRRVLSSGRIFNGLVYIPIGLLLSKHKMHVAFCWILFLLGFIGRVFVTNSIAVTYLLIASSIGLFGLIARIQLSDSKMYMAFRNMSTTIYLIHLLVWTGYYMSVYGTKTYGLDCFVVVSIVSTMIAYGYYWMNQRKNNKLLISS